MLKLFILVKNVLMELKEIQDTVCTLEEINSLFISNQQKLLKYCLKLTMNKFDADDLLSEVYLRIIKFKNSFTKGTNFSAWSATIAIRIFIDSKKKGAYNKYSFVNYEDVIDKKLIDNLAGENILKNEINNSICKLNVLEKNIFELYVKGYKYTEIQDMLRMPLGTVKCKLFNIKRKIAKDLKDYKI